MTVSPRRIAGIVLTATALALPLAAATTSSAHADTRCVIHDFGPRTIAVGLSPKVVEFPAPSADGCDSVAGWSVEGDSFFVYDGAPQWVFQPYDNTDTSPQDIVVRVLDSDGDESVRVFPHAFTMKRSTVIDRVNATPEPVRKGATITVHGRQRTADWEEEAYVGRAGRSVQVQFRTSTGTFTTVKTVKTTAKGVVSARVKAKADGYWRLRYAGSSTAGSTTSKADFVDVR